MRAVRSAGLTVLVAGALFAQNGDAPRFEIADVHPSPKTAIPLLRIAPPRNGRYEIRNATMLNLIGTAYGFGADTILGGPNWLELDHFDVTAKLPSGVDLETQKAMLRSLLEERFKVVPDGTCGPFQLGYSQLESSRISKRRMGRPSLPDARSGKQLVRQPKVVAG